MLDLLGATGDDVTAVCHGTTVATNQLLEGKVERLGFITTEGYEFMLEIARQAVPDGYGNSYFWVKPPRIVPADLVRTVGGRLDFEGAEVRPFDEERRRRRRPLVPRRAASPRSASASCTPTPTTSHELRDARGAARASTPTPSSRSQLEVLREYREYERSMTTLVDAAVKPQRRAATSATSTPGSTSSPAARPIPFYVMKSNGGVLSADEVVHQPITTVLSGPAAGALGAGADRAAAPGFDQVLTCDGGGTSTDVTVVLDGEPTLTTEGTVGAYPSKIPMIDVVTVGAGGGSIAWISPEGTLKVGPAVGRRRPRPALLRPRAAPSRPSPTRTCVLGRIPPHLLGGEIPLDVDAARGRHRRARPRSSASTLERCATGILEISAWNQANALRQVTVKRGLDVRDFTLATFGGSGSLLACRLVDILGLAGVARAAEPGQRLGVRAAHRRRQQRLRADRRRPARRRSTTPPSQQVFDDLDRPGRARRWTREGFAARRARATRAPPTCATSARPTRCASPAPDGAVDEALRRRGRRRASTTRTAQLYGYDFRDDPRQQVEWVNLRVTGVGPIRRPDAARARGRRRRSRRARSPAARRVCFDGAGSDDARSTGGPTCGPGDVVAGPAVIEEFGSTVPVHPGFAVTRRRARQPAAHQGVAAQ